MKKKNLRKVSSIYKEVMAMYGYSQGQFARILDRSPQSVSLIILGKRDVPGSELLEVLEMKKRKLSESLGI